MTVATARRRNANARIAALVVHHQLRQARADLEYHLGPIPNGPVAARLEEVLVSIEQAIRVLVELEADT